MIYVGAMVIPKTKSKTNNITNLTQNGNRITMNVTNMNAAYFTVRTGNRNTNVMTLEAPGYITTNDLNAP